MTPDLTPAVLDELAGNAARAGHYREWPTADNNEYSVCERTESANVTDFVDAADPATVAALVDEVKRRRAAEERVRQLHVRDINGFCGEDRMGWPCPTVRALDGPPSEAGD